jgi:hypothetical protein
VGSLVAGLSGFSSLVGVIPALATRRWSLGRYLATTAYALLWPIHLWSWQFELTERGSSPLVLLERCPTDRAKRYRAADLLPPLQANVYRSLPCLCALASIAALVYSALPFFLFHQYSIATNPA